MREVKCTLVAPLEMTRVFIDIAGFLHVAATVPKIVSGADDLIRLLNKIFILVIPEM